jgi:preprotein translocase subunit SecD
MKYSLRLPILVLVAISFVLPVKAVAEAPVFQIRAVAEPESSAFETFTLKQSDSVESVRVNPTVWLDDADIESVTAQTGADGIPAIIIMLTETATKRWGILTTNFAGKRLAILLLGRLVSAPTIRQPLLGSRIEISGGFSEAEAKEIVEKLNGRTAR